MQEAGLSASDVDVIELHNCFAPKEVQIVYQHLYMSVCLNHDIILKIECESKWQHNLKYQCIGVFVVNDGRTVANFLDDSS